MLFVMVYSWEKEKRDEIIKRRLEKGRVVPSGVKVLGEWTAIGRRVGFEVIEADDQLKLLAPNRFVFLSSQLANQKGVRGH